MLVPWPTVQCRPVSKLTTLTPHPLAPFIRFAAVVACVVTTQTADSDQVVRLTGPLMAGHTKKQSSQVQRY